MKVALVGAVQGSRVALDAFASAGFQIHVCSLDPNRASRHSDYLDLAPLAAKVGAQCTPIVNVNAPETVALLREFRPDILAVLGWSQVCGPELLAVPRLGALGWHPSALPANRGRAVIPWTILQRVRETAFSVFWMDEGVDSGDLFAQVSVNVAADETSRTLYNKLADAATLAITDVARQLKSGKMSRTPQNHANATYCAKRDAEDARVDWRMKADDVWTLIRAASEPYGGAFTDTSVGRLRIWAASPWAGPTYWGLPGQVQAFAGSDAIVQCGDRAHIRLTRVQFEGSPERPPRETLRMNQHLRQRS